MLQNNGSNNDPWFKIVVTKIDKNYWGLVILTNINDKKKIQLRELKAPFLQCANKVRVISLFRLAIYVFANLTKKYKLLKEKKNTKISVLEFHFTERSLPLRMFLINY